MKELKNDVMLFCSTTSIQGMRNVADPQQCFILKTIWILVVTASFVLSGICIKESIDGTIFKFKNDLKIRYLVSETFQYQTFSGLIFGSMLSSEYQSLVWYSDSLGNMTEKSVRILDF